MDRRKSWAVFLASGLLFVACGGEDGVGDPTQSGTSVTQTPATRCDKVCNACTMDFKPGTDVVACITECNEEYRATPEEEACLDRDGGFHERAAADGVTPDDPRYAEGYCYMLRECGDFW